MSGCARKISRLIEVGRVVVRWRARECRDERRVDRDEVGLLARLQRSDPVGQPEDAGALERPQPQPVERLEDGAALVASERRAFCA